MQFARGLQVLRPVAFHRPHRFDSLLVEPGPPALLTDQGIVLIHNGANRLERGDPAFPAFNYQPGQALFDKHLYLYFGMADSTIGCAVAPAS
jgi:beta-1,2-mannosidase